MGINLIDKIVPKNDAFVGLVNANQVIGTSGGALTSYLPSSAISSNSIIENYLRISNTPTDGYFLKYKDDTDQLTWSEVVGGTDVAWSGASEFYGFSSNAQYLYAPSGKIKSGYALVSDGGVIVHGFVAKPRSVYIMPSGNVSNFGISCRVDSTNITIGMTAPGERHVFWSASLL
jgi:hypothetical protein